ncbi:hypothetical protein NSI01_38570 [Pimelobacter simplex]|nr:hypothetical protein NSI01_38570 [Pimelobacter simplex]
MTAIGNRNKARGREFKVAVAEALREAGHINARPDLPVTISQHLRSPGDISGVPAVLAVCASERLDLSTSLNEAACTAKYLGRPWYAAVLSRRGASVAQSYVVMDLATFGKLLHHVPEDD